MADNMAREVKLVESILAYCRQRAIDPADPDTNEDHERDMWAGIQAAFADQCPGDLLDLIDDYQTAITAAMYRGGKCPAGGRQ